LLKSVFQQAARVGRRRLARSVFLTFRSNFNSGFNSGFYSDFSCNSEHNMQHPTPELFWLTLTVLFTATLWVPYILQLIVQMGVVGAFWDPYHETPHEARWAQRAKRAHTNAVENLIVFAPLALALTMIGAGSPLTAYASALFFFVRVAHYFAYTLAIPLVRTLLFIAGFGCQVVLGLRLLQVL